MLLDGANSMEFDCNFETCSPPQAPGKQRRTRDPFLENQDETQDENQVQFVQNLHANGRKNRQIDALTAENEERKKRKLAPKKDEATEVDGETIRAWLVHNNISSSRLITFFLQTDTTAIVGRAASAPQKGKLGSNSGCDWLENLAPTLKDMLRGISGEGLSATKEECGKATFPPRRAHSKKSYSWERPWELQRGRTWLWWVWRWQRSRASEAFRIRVDVKILTVSTQPRYKYFWKGQWWMRWIKTNLRKYLTFCSCLRLALSRSRKSPVQDREGNSFFFFWQPLLVRRATNYTILSPSDSLVVAQQVLSWGERSVVSMPLLFALQPQLKTLFPMNRSSSAGLPTSDEMEVDFRDDADPSVGDLHSFTGFSASMSHPSQFSKKKTMLPFFLSKKTFAALETQTQSQSSKNAPIIIQPKTYKIFE